MPFSGTNSQGSNVFIIGKLTDILLIYSAGCVYCRKIAGVVQAFIDSDVSEEFSTH